jgi:hypothetical protein
MTIAVMQPYLFPYLGYYQLASAVDKFIFFDDVNFINKGWINRNRILQQHEPFKFTLPLSKASQNRLINEIEISDFPKWRTEFLKLLEFNYKKAPSFPFFYEWLNKFLYQKDYKMISELAADSVSHVSELLGLSTEFMLSSNLKYKDDQITGGQDKILRICELLNANKYINPQNGVDIYDEEGFKTRQIDLKFIKMDDIQYKQFDKEKFAPALSIIDLLMFNDLSDVKGFLKMYTLINKPINDGVVQDN